MFICSVSVLYLQLLMMITTMMMMMMMIKFGVIHGAKFSLLPRLADVHMKYVKLFNKRVTEKQLRPEMDCSVRC